MFKSIYRSLASLKLAVVMLVVLAAVLAWATFLEAAKGREYAQWYIYRSSWFVTLLAVLGANILSAALIRFPWKRRQIGFVVTHAGLIVLLAGSITTFLHGIEGQMVLQEGERLEKILIKDRSVITALSHSARGRRSSEFSFCPGPVDWPEERSIDWGEEDGLGLKVLKYYRHARERISWVADEVDYQGPALKLELSDPAGNPVATDWLTGNLFGGEAVIGPTSYEVLPISSDSLLEDFRDPPTKDLGQAGILSIHHEGQMQRVHVDQQIGKKIPVGQSGIEVEIVEYLADARPTPKGKFVSRSDTPDNPVLELKIHQPDRDEPRRQIAVAKKPLLNLDAVHGQLSTVKFWYHHPTVTPVSGAVFLQTPAGKLYCRPVVGGSYGPAREAKAGDTIQIGGNFEVTIEDYIVRAREEVTFDSVELARGETTGAEAAVLVELSGGGHRRQTWLRRHDPRFGTQQVFTPQGVTTLSFGYEQLPLGYGIELLDFVRKLNPGRVGNAAFASSVRLIDPAADVAQQHEISMNEPLAHGKFTFYQSSFQETPGGMEVSVLTAAYDPGRFLKYLGSLMICTGIFIMFYMRAYLFQNVPRLIRRQTEDVELAGQRHDVSSSQHLARPAARRTADMDVSTSVS